MGTQAGVSNGLSRRHKGINRPTGLGDISQEMEEPLEAGPGRTMPPPQQLPGGCQLCVWTLALQDLAEATTLLGPSQKPQAISAAGGEGSQWGGKACIPPSCKFTPPQPCPGRAHSLQVKLHLTGPPLGALGSIFLLIPPRDGDRDHPCVASPGLQQPAQDKPQVGNPTWVFREPPPAASQGIHPQEAGSEAELPGLDPV